MYKVASTTRKNTKRLQVEGGKVASRKKQKRLKIGIFIKRLQAKMPFFEKYKN